MQHTKLVPVINREAQLQEFTQRLDRMLADLDVFDCVLFVHGVSSVGKTTVLGEMRREAAKRGVPAATVDFDREQFVDGRLVDNLYDGPGGQVQVAKRLMDELAHTASFVPGRPIDAGLTSDQAVTHLFDFARDLYGFGQRRPFALFFDTVEDSDLDTFRWAQEHILQPLLESFHMLIVIAGRAQPNTSQQQDLIYPLERRMHKLPLRPFDSKQTDEQLITLKATGIDLQGEDLIQYTSGLPGLNAAAAEWLVKRRPKDQLLSHLVQEIIFGRVAGRFRKRDLTAEVLAVSVLRQFDSGLLRQLMDDLWPAKYPTSGVGPVHRLLKNLQESRLVEIHPDGYGYTVPHDLRPVLDLYWQQSQPEKHLRVHHTAALWFKEQIAEGDYVAIADRLYHLGGLWRDLDATPELAGSIEPDLRPPSIPQDHLRDELQAALDSLQESGYRVYDLATKIQNVLGQPEFKMVFAPQVIETLVGMCEAFKERLP